jgi:outer membrane lipoprotein-sorting protein
MRITGILSLLLIAIAPVSQGQTASEIIKKAEDKMRSGTLYAEMKITTIRPKWTREMSMKSWSKGTERSFVVITAPSKDKGIVYLKRDKEIWNWMPSIERTIKMPPSMMSQSWMGTDFSNDDLVQESSTVKDYDHKIIGEEAIDNRKCWKIELKPKPEAPVVWGKVIIWIDQKDFMQLKTQQYDEDEYLINTLLASDIKQMGGKTIPSKLTLLPEDKQDYKTIMEYIDMDFDQDIKDAFFSIQNMKKLGR